MMSMSMSMSIDDTMILINENTGIVPLWLYDHYT